MAAPDQTTADTFTVRGGSDGEVLVTAPDGRVQFMGLWDLVRFAWVAMRAGKRVVVIDD